MRNLAFLRNFFRAVRRGQRHDLETRVGAESGQVPAHPETAADDPDAIFYRHDSMTSTARMRSSSEITSGGVSDSTLPSSPACKTMTPRLSARSTVERACVASC